MISDESITNKQTEYYERGVLKKEVRSYEVSLWTLQDTFITVLKWSDVEQRGRIENPKMTLSTDGTQNFEFSIPMYIWQHGEKIENPNWHNTQDGTLIAATRKIKVIFNKGESDEAVYEFIILDVTESHEGEIATCQVKCEGLAFHELGKIGYNYSLSQENFITAYEKWQDNGATGRAPIQNIDYWCQEINLEPYPVGTTEIDPRIWYYQVQMVYGTMEIDAGSGQAVAFSNIIYEEPFVSEWDENLNPTKIERQREKARPIEASQSNIYNITQQIAQTFGVFCRYEYRYDVNYHIIARTIVFYNSFSAESNGIQSFTYPYTSSAISRTKDATNLTTKLYVLNLDDETAYDGYRSIMNVAANKTRENYIMNFDYMKEIGNIDKEQHDQIVVYEKLIRRLNLQLIKLQGNLAAYQQQVPEIEAKITVYKNSIEIGEKERAQAEELLAALTDDTGILQFDANNPDVRFIFKQDSGYSLQFSTDSKGIYPQTIKVYSQYDQSSHVLSSEFPGVIRPIEDESKNVIGLNLYLDAVPRGTYEIPNKVYLTYKYKPSLYYEKIIDMWNLRILTDNTHLEEQKVLLYGNPVTEQGRTVKLDPDGVERDDTGLLGLIDSITTNIDELLAEKKELILKFERMMGPALREGYWQPDSYIDYGNQKYGEHSFVLETGKAANFKDQIKNVLYADSQDSFIAGWDPNLEDTEQDTYYYLGFSNEGTPNKTYYHYIDLSGKTFSENISNYSFIFQNPLENGTSPNEYTIESTKIFGIGADALVCYLARKNSNNTYNIIPALVLIGEKGLAEYEMTNMENGQRMRAIGKISYTTQDNHVVLNVQDGVGVTVEQMDEDDFIVYPRLKFSSLMLKTDTSSFFLSYNKALSNSTTQRVLFDRFSDYYLITKTISRTENNEKNYYVEHFFTIKPEALFSAGLTGAENKTSLTVRADYTISNADVAIYLDALDISKENAYPKVSYEITPNVIDASLMRIMYKQLARIIMINDPELKLEDAFGYISSIDLDLDNPWQDTITVQNYTNKFEDLFASIVASSESMQKVSGMMGNMLTGGIPLSPEAFQETLNMNQDIMNAYLEANFDGLEVVQEKLAELFNEASQVLGASSNALNDLSALTADNAGILSGFVQNIADDLTPKTFRSRTRPTKFKEGDIWIKLDNSNNEIARYVATSNSDDVKNATSDTAGFTRIADGTLAQIKGAAIDIDTVSGNIDLRAQHDIGISANSTVNIVGGEEINIGGPTVNIAAASTGGVVGGINIVASAYNNINTSSTSISKVLIHPKKIELGSADILMRGENAIQMISSRDTLTSTNAVSISPDDGIWIGSGKGVRIYSGKVNVAKKQNSEIYEITGGSGASVELLPDQLLMGVSTTNDGAVMKMTTSYIVFGTGSAINGTNGSTIINNGVTGKKDSSHLTGMKLTKDSFGLATTTTSDNVTTVHAFIMNDKGITIGTTTNSGGFDFNQSNLKNASNMNGSYVRIAASGIELGSGSNLYINTNNVKLQTNNNDTRFAIGSGFNSITGASMTGVFTDDGIGLVYNSNGLFIKGNIYATSGEFSGKVTATSGEIADFTIGQYRMYFTYQDSGTTKYTGLYKSSNGRSFYAGATANWGENAPFYVRNDGYLYATKGLIGGWTLNSTTLYTTYNVTVNNESVPRYVGIYTGNGPAFYAGATTNEGANAVFSVTKAGKLTCTDADIQGKITATSGSIGGMLITSSYIASEIVINGTKYNKDSVSSITKGVYLGSDGLSISSNYNTANPTVVSQADTLLRVKVNSNNITIGEYGTNSFLSLTANSSQRALIIGKIGNFTLFKLDAITSKLQMGIESNKTTLFTLDAANHRLTFDGALSIVGESFNYIYNKYVDMNSSTEGNTSITGVQLGLTTMSGLYPLYLKTSYVERTASSHYVLDGSTYYSFAVDASGRTHVRQLITGDSIVHHLNVGGNLTVAGETTLSGIINGVDSGNVTAKDITGLTGRYILITGGGGSDGGKCSIWWIQFKNVFKICGGTIVSVTTSTSSTATTPYTIKIVASAESFYQLYKIS